jgi:hypothetical protein
MLKKKNYAVASPPTAFGYRIFSLASVLDWRASRVLPAIFNGIHDHI